MTMLSIGEMRRSADLTHQSAVEFVPSLSADTLVSNALRECLVLARRWRENCARNAGHMYPSSDDSSGADSKSLSSYEVSAAMVEKTLRSLSVAGDQREKCLLIAEAWNVARGLLAELVKQTSGTNAGEDIGSEATVLIGRLNGVSQYISGIELSIAATPDDHLEEI